MDRHSILWLSYHGLSFWSKFIRLLSWWASSVVHTGYLSKDENTVYEAWKAKGANKHPWEESHHTHGTPVDVLEIECPDWFEYRFYEYLEKTAGKVKYDTLGVVLGFLGKWVRQNPDKVFCSEWGFDAQDYANKKRPEGVDPFYILARIPAYKVSPALAHLTPRGKLIKTIYTP